MTVVWRPEAGEQLAAVLRYLSERNDTAAHEMLAAVEAAARRLEGRPRIARKSQYPGFLIWSLTKWKKIIVFHEIDAGIEIAAFLDARQIPPKSIR